MGLYSSYLIWLLILEPINWSFEGIQLSDLINCLCIFEVMKSMGFVSFLKKHILPKNFTTWIFIFSLLLWLT